MSLSLRRGALCGAAAACLLATGFSGQPPVSDASGVLQVSLVSGCTSVYCRQMLGEIGSGHDQCLAETSCPRLGSGRLFLWLVLVKSY